MPLCDYVMVWVVRILIYIHFAMKEREQLKMKQNTQVSFQHAHHQQTILFIMHRPAE